MVAADRERVLALREEALDYVRSERFDEAIERYDDAIALASDDDELRELVTIGKADALLASNRSGPEIQELPAILLRRRSPRNTMLAAYALMFRARLQGDVKRALFYGQTAVEAARDMGDPLLIGAALNELGNIYELDSHFEDAVSCFRAALHLLKPVPDSPVRRLAYVAIAENLGYSLIQTGELREGIDLVHEVIGDVPPSGRSDANLDLCLGYLYLGAHDKAVDYGARALDLAGDDRERRNALYLLGEAYCAIGDTAEARTYFDRLATYYPEFRDLTNVLMAVDLRPLLNLRR